MKYKLNFTDLGRQYGNIKSEILKNIEEVLESTKYINGPQVSMLEQEIANYTGVKYAIGVGSGTDALLISLMAFDIKPGEEIITTPFTFIATAEVISLLGAKPVFVDIDEKSFNIDVNQIEEKITNRTRGIIPVHLYGQMAEMDKIMEITKKYNLFVIEDAAQAMGSEYKNKKAGSIGDTGCFSFFPAKNLGAYGDAGMIVTNNKNLADKIRILREHGSAKKYQHQYIGINGRLDTLQAAILLVKVKYLDSYIDNRIKLAKNYSEQLKDYVRVPEILPDRKHTFNQFTIRTEKRDQLQKYLESNGIPTAIHYPMPLHLQPCFKYLGYEEGEFPVAEKISKEVLSLPMFPEMTEEEQNMVIDTIISFFKK